MSKFSKAAHVYIALKEITPHPSVQRKFNAEWAKKIAKDFDPDKFGELSVVKAPDGRYFVWDGQHRHAGAMMALGEEQKVPCLLYDGLTEVRQAELFLGRNNVRSVRALDKFLIAVRANREAETAITRILAQFNLTLSDQLKPDSVRAPAALLKVYRMYGDAILVRALGILDGAWKHDADAFDGAIIRGIARLVHEFAADMDDKDFSRKLGRSGGPSRMLAMARDHTKTIGGTIDRAIAMRALNIYNAKRRSGALRFTTKTRSEELAGATA